VRALRQIRRRLTAGIARGAFAAAPIVPPGLINLAERTIAGVGPHMPRLSRQVEENMRAAGVYTPDAVRAYFRQVAEHLANGIRIFRRAARHERLADWARDAIDADPSIDRARDLVRQHASVLFAPPHVCNYLLSLARLNLETPVCVYLRWSKDAHRRRMKEAWCRAAGISVILEPESASDPTSRAAACVEALRAGKSLVMTPDIAQKVGRGVGIRLFNRRAYLPGGAASIAMLADVPLVPVYGDDQGGRRHRIHAGKAITVAHYNRKQGGRQRALAEAMQDWIDQFTTFVTDHPSAWFLWGDSRWTRALHDDPAYAAAPNDPIGNATRADSPEEVSA